MLKVSLIKRNKDIEGASEGKEVSPRFGKRVRRTGGPSGRTLSSGRTLISKKIRLQGDLKVLQEIKNEGLFKCSS